MLTHEQINACVAFTAAVQAAGLLGEGGPLLDLDLLAHESWPPSPVASWALQATDAQRARYAEILAGWDWSPEGTTAERKRAAKAEAKAAFSDAADPARVAARNADRALYRSIVQARNKVNELITWANAQGASISPLTNRTFAQAMAAAAALVDAETDPAGD